MKWLARRDLLREADASNEAPALAERPPYVQRRRNLGLPPPPLQPLAAPFSAMGAYLGLLSETIAEARSGS